MNCHLVYNVVTETYVVKSELGFFLCNLIFLTVKNFVLRLYT